ncbi:MAG: hypothetical protein OXG35_16085, partial [Acidobacteria bacterium]|nr:hypothetical protein [Acidobacteriota bacterium]
WLDSNRLSGRIPTELGALTRLGHLSLDRNAGLSGPLPAEFGNLTTLWTLRLNDTGLTGPLPLPLANLRSLNYMDVRNTGLCAPEDPAFQSWLRTVNVNGGIATCTRPSVNRRPAPVGVLPPLTLGVDDAAATVEVGGAFRDPDGDALTYGAASSAPAVAAVAVLGSTVTVTPMGEGTATVTVTATDAGGSNGTATQTFMATVHPAGARRFTDDPIVPGVTPVRAVHFSELRTRIDVLRRGAGLAPFGWTDPVLLAGVTPVRLVHLTELRSALAEAYAAAGRAAPRWADSASAAGSTPILAAHLTELRAAVLALE